MHGVLGRSRKRNIAALCAATTACVPLVFGAPKALALDVSDVGIQPVAIPFEMPAQRMKFVADVQEWGMAVRVESTGGCLSVFRSCALGGRRNFVDGTSSLFGSFDMNLWQRDALRLGVSAGWGTDLEKALWGSPKLKLDWALPHAAGAEARMEFYGTVPCDVENGCNDEAFSLGFRANFKF